MSLYTLYDWITSLLRPRGRFKSIEDQRPDSSQSVVAVNRVELIPTLNFIAAQPAIPTATYADRQDVAATCCDDDYSHTVDDSESRQTYIIDSEAVEAAASVSEEALALASAAATGAASTKTKTKTKTTTTTSSAQAQQEANLSLTDASSFVDEPTSSISIEMDYSSKATMSLTATATTTTTETTDSVALTGTTTTTTTTGAAATTTSSTRDNSRSAITSSATPNSDQSIEEDIEEAIELTDELEEDVLADSLRELSEAAGYAKSTITTTARTRTPTSTTSKKHPLEMFGIEDDVDDEDGDNNDDDDADDDRDDDDAVLNETENSSSKGSFNKNSSSDGQQFKIDDDQLSGGKLAQHFVLDDDDDDEEEEGNGDGDGDNNAEEDDDDDEEEDDFSGIDISLPMVKRVVHSQHNDSSVELGADQRKDSLANESTADDVSDFVDEPRQGEDPVERESEQFDLPLPEATHTHSDHEAASPLHKSAAEASHKAISNTSNTEISKTGNIIAAASPEHSEKDHSVEEIVEANHSIDMTFDEQNVSSLNASFVFNNETMVNRLLTDTIEGVASQHNTMLHTEAEKADEVEADEPGRLKAEKALDAPRFVTDLDDSADEPTTEVTIAKSESFNLAQNEAKLIEHKSARVSEILQLQPVVEEATVAESQHTRENIPDSGIDSGNVPTAGDLAKGHRTHLRGEAGDDVEIDEDEEENNSLQLMKLRIFAMKLQPKEHVTSFAEVSNGGDQTVKAMERVPLTEFSKDVLEDITEESERNSLSTAEEQQSLSIEKSLSTAKSDNKQLPADLESSNSVVSLNLLRMAEDKVCGLQAKLASKDAGLAALNLQLDASQRRESFSAGGGGSISTEQPISGRDTSSLVTNSTEYRTFQEDFGGATMDIYMELSKRDELISKLTDSLQQSVNVRENLQTVCEKLTTEVELLRKQLTEASETLRRPYWPRDQESNGGQRISEISMDLISESDDDLDRQFLTDNEDKYSYNSRERQLSMPRQVDEGEAVGPTDWSQPPFSKQIEQFQKYLTPSEVRLFFMVQKKFDDFLSQELEKCKMKNDTEYKVAIDRLESEKLERDNEIKRMINVRQEKDELHAKEMEELRKYFETKCADLEKQFSDDVFSQKSQHHGADSSSESSDQDQMPEEVMAHATPTKSKESSPRKRTRAELLLSPSHRQITPSADAFSEDQRDGNGNLSMELADMKAFYQNKIHDLQRLHEERLRKQTEKVKYYENRYPDDEFMSPMRNEKNTTVTTTGTPIATTTTDTTEYSVAQHVCDPNTSLIIIDRDELNMNNESQVIQKIIEEYERRLQEQLTLAREDIVHELEQQIQTLLSETTTDDHHWPPELILLRERFTAKSQLQIAQLQIKHEEEMSRLRIEYENQLSRKTKRHMTFDSYRELDILVGERDDLRAVLKAFHRLLVQLTKCVVNCEDDLNATIVDEVQRLLVNNRTLLEEVDSSELHITLNASLINASLTATKQMRLVPDVHNLLEVVEEPSLLKFISSKGGDLADDFDLKECLDRLKGEAAYLLQLSENYGKHRRRMSDSSGDEKNDSCCEAEECLRLLSSYDQTRHRILRANSLNEQQLTTYRPSDQPSVSQPLSSLPPDLNRIRDDYEQFSTPGGNASELNFQVHELKNRLVKSEADRLKLQQELEHTISRNSVLGQELQALRDQCAQLNSLNSSEYAEGYGLGSQRLSDADRTFSSFAQLQERARNLLSTPTQPQNSNDTTVLLLQMIEDFCREGDKVAEGNKKDRDDLQAQIDAADKQLRATRQFLEEQAAEREQERDEFVREIERLRAQLRDKERERMSLENASQELEQLELQIRDLTQKLNESNSVRDKFEIELKASIDKIFVLREIISELETQIETKALNEHVLSEKVKQLEEYVNAQNRSNESLQIEVQSLKNEIDDTYQGRIRVLEEKLQNVRPSAEQSMVMDQVVEQLRDVENTLEQKTKTLEALHHAVSANSCSEDISAQGSHPVSLVRAIVTPPQGSPVHPSPRQHSLTMEGVQRIIEKLSKHTRVEEAAIKRIRDLEMQVTQIRSSCVDLQHERDSLQERMSEQTQRISALQSRLEEQRQRAEEIQRAGTSNLNIRIHDLQTEVQNMRETLELRDKQIATMKGQLEKSKLAIDRLEAELAVEHQPDRSIVERLEAEVKQKAAEIQKLKDRIKTEMINKMALPDLMETMLADKNEEIDHLREQLDIKEKELQAALDASHGSSGGNGGHIKGDAKDDVSTKLSARTLSDIVSITEFDEPDVVRRAANNSATPLCLPEARVGHLHNTMETSKEAVANLTQKRTEDLSLFAPVQSVNTFEHPHYFQDPNMLMGSGISGSSATPSLVPRQINFSALTEDSKLKTPLMMATPNHNTRNTDRLENEVAELRKQLREVTLDKKNITTQKEDEKCAVEADLVAAQLTLKSLQQDLEEKQQEISALKLESEQKMLLQKELTTKNAEIQRLLDEQAKLSAASEAQRLELLSKNEKNLCNYRENEEKYTRRIAELEESVLKATENEVSERESLRKELKCLSEVHEQCKYAMTDAEARKKEIEKLNQEIRAKNEHVHNLTSKLYLSEDAIGKLLKQIDALESDVEKLRQQQNSENSSKQFSVDEIAKQVEKELNYSAQLDSNILRAIESEEENNLDVKHLDKKNQLKTEGTDDENFIGERALLNQLEALKAQIAVEREQNEEIRHELLVEKQHSQEVQEQDMIVIEAMRKRLETAVEKEDELHKQLDFERDRCERLQTQLTALQRAESRRNSSLLMKSPSESPRKSPRSLSDYESELAERLRSEIKLLSAQNERERERNVDLQRSSERERQRYENELQERVEYCEKVKREMEKIARDKDNAEVEIEHLQERLTLQTQEIESLEARLATLQEAETRHSTRREKHQKESTMLLAEMQELRTQLLAIELERESLTKTITSLRYDVERSAQREAKMADALANANANLATSESSVPQQFLQKMKEINELLTENTQENRQMAETVQFLVEERRQLQKRCEDLEAQLSGSGNIVELEERCKHLLGRYLRVESHRKALIFQKRYLKVSLQSYQDSEQRALVAMHGSHVLLAQRKKRNLFKTVALAIIAIQRMHYIGRIWYTGKRIVSKSVFTITQQKRSQAPIISCTAISSTSPSAAAGSIAGAASSTPQQLQPIHSPFQSMGRQLPPLQAPALVSDYAGGKSPAQSPAAYDWSSRL